MADLGLERRRAARIPVDMSVEVTGEHGFSLLSASDVSVGGVFFDRAIPMAVGAEVDLSFVLPGTEDAIACVGRVVNVPDAKDYGMGIRFQELSPEQQQALETFVKESEPGEP